MRLYHFILVYHIKSWSVWLPPSVTQISFQYFLCKTQGFFDCVKLANNNHLQ